MFPYITDMPAFLEVPNNPYLESLIYENTFKLINTKQPTVDSSSGAAEYQNMYLIPYHAAKIIDRRLDAPTVSQWTAVLADEVLLRRLLESYFMFEYSQFSFFHKDSFLEDMTAGRNRFCSSLLVNAVLASACVSIYTSLIKYSLTNTLDYSTAMMGSNTEPTSGILGILDIASSPRPKGY